MGEAGKAFVDLKSCFSSRPILRPPDISKNFFMAVHASNVAVGVGLHLFQMMELSIMFVISVKEN